MTAAYWKLLRLRALFVRSNLINKIDQFATHRAGTEKIIGMPKLDLLKKFRVGKWLTQLDCNADSETQGRYS